MAAADARLLRLLSTSKREALTAALRDLIRASDEAAAAPVLIAAAKKPKADKPKKAKADKADKPKKKKLKKAA